MDPKTLKSSIKAYCLELLETSVSADAGEYLTKKAFRKPKKQDIKSPTGFESSPKPNMYSKTMKFKIVDPKERLNSKDLWNEYINENNTPSPNNFPIRISSYEMGQMVGSWLNKHGYKVDITNPPFNVGKGKFIPFTLNSDDSKNIRINEIKINKPKRVWDFTSYIPNFKLRNIQVGDKIKIRYGEHDIVKIGDPGIDRILFYTNYSENPTINNPNSGFEEETLLFINDENKPIQESRYTQFKRQTSKPKPREILHRAIKEIQMKLDEVNRLIEFTTRIKGELTENDQEIEYLKRTKDSLYKIQDKLKEAFRNISSINEIKINKPIRTWDFTKPIPNFDVNNIKVGDRILTKKEDFIINIITKGNDDFQTKYYGKEGEGYISKSSLIFMNKIRNNQ